MGDRSQDQEMKDMGGDGQQTQASRDAIALQNSQMTINRSFISLFGNRTTAPGIDWDWAMKILKQQQPDIKKRLKDSLFGLAEVDAVEMESKRQEASPALALEAKKTLTVNGTDAGTIDPQAPIIATYAREDIDGSLLILGTPGAGKTITLLKLAEQLVGEAIAQPQTVIPIIFELSTWRDGQEIEAWLIEQLYENYGGKREIYKMWVERRVLLPLLDGLDELGMVRQKACTEKVNAFARTYPQVVVCCRVKEFQQAGVNLSNLRGKVQLQPLSDRQLELYLQQMGKTGLWEQIQTVPEMGRLLEPVIDKENADYDEPGLLRVPLFISLAAQIYERDQPLKGKADLFDRYIDVREGDRRKELQQRKWAFKTVEAETSWRETRYSLGWVARQLQDRNQVELSVENIQPSYIETKRHQWLYWFLLFELNLLNIVFFGVLFFLNSSQSEVMIISPINSLSVIVASGFLFSMVISTESKSDTVRIFSAFIYYILNFLFKIKIPQNVWRHTPILHDLSLDSKIGLRLPHLPNKIDFKDLFYTYVESCRTIGSVAFMIFIFFVHELCMETIILISRIFKFDRVLNKSEQAREEIYDRHREYLKGSNYKESPYWPHLYVFANALAIVDYYIFDNNGKIRKICFVLLVSPVVIMILLITSLTGLFFIFVDDFRTPYEKSNQGRIEKIKFLILHTILATGFLLFRSYIPSNVQSSNLYWVLGGFGVLFALFSCLDLNKYFALRVVLWQAKIVPWNLARFLTYGHERRLLQQVGGRYRFIHRELLEHFAGMENGEL